MCIYDNNKNCAILISKRCIGCRFSRTQEQDEARTAKKYARLNTLTGKAQAHIADKYYRGVMEWQN